MPATRPSSFNIAGSPLPYQIEEWDAAKGAASVWVRVPSIKGNDRQELRLHWGKADAASASSGAAVFNESNGYLGVWHMSDPVRDEVGTLASKDAGTAASEGVVGPARHFAGQQGIFCGEQITNSIVVLRKVFQEIQRGAEPYEALLSGSVAKLRPVYCR